MGKTTTKIITPGKSFTELITGMEFVWVPSGKFMMSSPSDDEDSFKSEIQHEVTLTRGFWIGKYQVTNAQYRKFLDDSEYDGSGDANSDYLKHFKGKSKMSTANDYPIVFVSWKNAKAFAEWLSHKTGDNYCLPREAEWEYACRSGGKNEKYSGGNNINAVAWYDANSGGHTHPVGTKAANGLGIHDMSGNVWEWCSDRYDVYRSVPVTNPVGPSLGNTRVNRGGAWNSADWRCRSTTRNWWYQISAYYNLGFRLVCILRTQ